MRHEISVIMSVYNTPQKYLKDAIDSILNQTYSNFEFLIIDDASTEKTTRDVLSSYKDSRISIFWNKENKGLTKNLNTLMRKANGKYIARMDADDISFSNRLEKQHQFMEMNQDVHVLGCFVKSDVGYHLFGGNMHHDMRKVKMLFYNAGLCHPSVMFRKSFLEKYNIRYDENIKKAQDYALWIECMKWTKLWHYPEPLIYYREHDNQISKISREGNGGQKYYARIIRSKQLEAAGINLKTSVLEVFFLLGEEKYNVDINVVEELFNILYCFNKQNNIWSQKELEKEMKLYMLKIWRANKGIKLKIKIFQLFFSPSFFLSLIYRFFLRTLFYNKIVISGRKDYE